MPVPLVLDTGVLVEYIMEGSAHADRLERILTSRGRLYTVPGVVAEVLYVSSRLYAAAGRPDPNGDASDYVAWLLSRVRVVSDRDIGLRAGELKKALGIALTDCFVIAAAERLGGRALFLRREREMQRAGDMMRDLPVYFLDELGDEVDV